MNPLEEKINTIITPVIKDEGFELVHLVIKGAESGGLTLQVMAENPVTKHITIDECAKLSREIAAVLDVEDPIEGRFNLEVSSPGIDRPLVKVQDFADFDGYEAKIEIEPPHEGQKRFRGILKGIENEEIIIATDQGEYALPYCDIKKAKLVLTDELINRHQKKA